MRLGLRFRLSYATVWAWLVDLGYRYLDWISRNQKRMCWAGKQLKDFLKKKKGKQLRETEKSASVMDQ